MWGIWIFLWIPSLWIEYEWIFVDIFIRKIGFAVVIDDCLISECNSSHLNRCNWPSDKAANSGTKHSHCFILYPINILHLLQILHSKILITIKLPPYLFPESFLYFLILIHKQNNHGKEISRRICCSCKEYQQLINDIFFCVCKLISLFTFQVL